MSDEEELLKLQEELKDVYFSHPIDFNDIEELRELKKMVDFIKTKNKK